MRVRVYQQCRRSHNTQTCQVTGRNCVEILRFLLTVFRHEVSTTVPSLTSRKIIYYHLLLPEVICCCLHNCGFDISGHSIVPLVGNAHKYFIASGSNDIVKFQHYGF